MRAFPERSSCLSDERLPREDGIVPVQLRQVVEFLLTSPPKKIAFVENLALELDRGGAAVLCWLLSKGCGL